MINSTSPEFQRLKERLDISVAFSERYEKSLAICYLRITALPKQQKGETTGNLSDWFQSEVDSLIRNIDTLEKVNNTDFILILTDITENECEVVLSRIIGTLNKLELKPMQRVTFGANIGVCMFPYGSAQKGNLVQFAKKQMEEAVINNRAISMYRPNKNEDEIRQSIIRNDLPAALQNNQLSVVFQPQLQLNTKKIIGMEALIRWQHPALGKISPVEFIPYAEAKGLLDSLFQWVFEEICKKIEKLKNYNISINLSVNQLLSSGLELFITNMADKYEVDLSRITLEITEEIGLYSSNKVLKRIKNLKLLGIKLALDDFGKGYFSFADFINFPVDIVKLDKSFVTSLASNSHLKKAILPIIQMAHFLGFKVVVEGIEEYRQLIDWEELKCDIVQGFFISKPLTLDEFIVDISKIEHRVNGLL
ncbi:EAL domain-containing protein [Cytobacillus firmus]|uniref:GGDEF domain-containing phosphodiesterase n=1 Tax=Cytobacillus firmus TaxID=1399 RepID=UPI0020C62FB6|nr:GGDEF domain-containing phosphodiesterase [Cytobacillus firmus]